MRRPISRDKWTPEDIARFEITDVIDNPDPSRPFAWIDTFVSVIEELGSVRALEVLADELCAATPAANPEARRTYLAAAAGLRQAADELDAAMPRETLLRLAETYEQAAA